MKRQRFTVEAQTIVESLQAIRSSTGICMELWNPNCNRQIGALSDIPCEFRMGLDWPCSSVAVSGFPVGSAENREHFGWKSKSTPKRNFAPCRFLRRITDDDDDDQPAKWRLDRERQGRPGHFEMRFGRETKPNWVESRKATALRSVGGCWARKSVCCSSLASSAKLRLVSVTSAVGWPYWQQPGAAATERSIVVQQLQQPQHQHHGNRDGMVCSTSADVRSASGRADDLWLP